MDRDRRGNSRERPAQSREESRRGKDQREVPEYPSRPSSRAGTHAEYRSREADRPKDRDYDEDRYGSSNRRADDYEDRHAGRREGRESRDGRRDADYGPTKSGRDDDIRTSKGGGKEQDYGTSSKQHSRAPGTSTGGAGASLPPTSRAGRLIAQERQQATSSSGRPRGTSPAGKERADDREKVGTPGSAHKTRGVTPGASNNAFLAELRKTAGQMFAGKAAGNAGSDDEAEAGEIVSPGNADEDRAGNARSNHGSPAVVVGRKRKHSPVTWAPVGSREVSKVVKTEPGLPRQGLSILDRAQAEAEALRRLEMLKDPDYDPDAPAAIKSSPSFSDDPDRDSAPGPVATSRRRHHDRSDSDLDMHDEAPARKPKASRWLQQDEEDDDDNRQGASPPATSNADGGQGPKGSSSPIDNDEPMPEIKMETDMGSEEGDAFAAAKEVAKKEKALPSAARYSMRRECRDVFDFERIEKISEGTYGVVYKAREKSTGRIVALKKVKMERETEGFPITSVREINILLNFHHPNIVQVEEIVVSKRDPDQIYMVMEYMDHDLKSLMDDKRRFSQPFSAGQVKCLLMQLIDGMAFLHKNWVLHRDLKTSNVLYNGKGELKLCDFGMARQYGEPLGKYSTNIVTLWYRAPELLFGTKVYNTAVDMWSVGCIFAELLTGKPLFPGQGEMDQIDKMLQLLGTPTPDDWPGLEALPGYKRLNLKRMPSTLRQRFAATAGFGQGVSLTEAGFDLLSRLLAWDPDKRISASEALQHRWFSEPPLPVHKVLMPTFAPRKAG